MSFMFSREKLYRAAKNSAETMQEWIKKLESLAESCNFSQERDIVLRDIFIIGLGHCPIQEILIQEISSNKNISFTKLIQKALQYEQMLLLKSENYLKDNSETNIVPITNSYLLKKTFQTNTDGQTVGNAFASMKTQNNINANQVIQNFSKPHDPVLPYNLKTKLSTFEGRHLEIKQIHDYFEKYFYKVVVICGLFGIGKSELCNKYAWEYIKYYNNNIIWIHYKTEEEFKNMCITIAKELDPKTDNWRKPIGQLVSDIYSYFEKKHKCLFVFDDVLSRNNINDILPNETYKNIRVLITSPYANWGNIKTIHLSFLSETETITLFQTVSKNFPCTEEQENFLKELLNGLPLLIQIFASYVANATDGIDKKIYFAEYSINLFYTKPYPTWLERNTDKTIYTSFTTILQKLQYLTEEEEANVALKILNYFPYIEEIPYLLLLELFDENALHNAIRILVDCSLIYFENKYIYMHKLLQSLVLLDQQKSQTETVWYKEILDDILLTNDSYETQERKVFSFAAERKEAVLKVYKNSKNQGKLIELLNKYECQFALDYIFSPTKEKLQQAKPEVKCKRIKEIIKVNEDNQIVDCCSVVETNHPIKDAALNGHLEVIKLLIETDQTLVYKLDEYDCIPFHTAASGGHIHILNYFLQTHKVPINIQNKNGSTALHLAALNGRTDVVTFLVEQKSSLDVLDNRGNTALHYACQTLHVETVKALLISGISIDVRNEKGDTPLHFASLEGKTEVVGFLHSQGADVTAIDDFNNNALHFSAQKGHVETTKKLIDLGCPMNIENHFGNTPLNLAVLKRHVMVVKVLCDNGCRPDEVSENDGTTPMSVASRNGFTEICSYFLTQFPDLYKGSSS